MIAQAPTPDLAPLFADFLDASIPLPALADRHNLDLLQLLELTESDAFRAHIEAFHALQALRASLIQSAALPAAMTTLTHLAASTPAPDEPHAATETRRKAARTVLTHARADSTPRTPETPDPTPPAAETPETHIHTHTEVQLPPSDPGARAGNPEIAPHALQPSPTPRPGPPARASP